MANASEHADMIADCEKRESQLTDWEAGFIDSVAKQIAVRPLSALPRMLGGYSGRNSVNRITCYKGKRMKNRRWSDDNRHFWPFTLSKDSRHGGYFAVMLDSGGAEGHSGGCHIRFSGFGWTLICELPPILRPYRERVTAHWDADTVARMGRDWYENSYAREVGFSVSEGALDVHYGAQTHCWPGSKSKVFWLPWRKWRFIRCTLYTPEGISFYTEYEGRRNWEEAQAFKDAVPKVRFDFEDYDGKRITATTHIEEREWRFGTSWCRWLSLFRKPRISRTLMLEFSEEVGPEKGSWKGGTVGRSFEMLAGETPEAAFIRYCQQEHRSRGGRYRVRYLGRATETVSASREEQ